MHTHTHIRTVFIDLFYSVVVVQGFICQLNMIVALVYFDKQFSDSRKVFFPKLYRRASCTFFREYRHLRGSLYASMSFYLQFWSTMCEPKYSDPSELSHLVWGKHVKVHPAVINFDGTRFKIIKCSWLHKMVPYGRTKHLKYISFSTQRQATVRICWV